MATSAAPQKAFAQVPANYRKGARHTWHQRRRHKAILAMLSTLQGSVLDYGCGYGDLTYAISQTHRACGADLDPDRVAFAAAEYAPLEFRLCEYGTPYPSHSFDIVTSIVVLNFVEDAARYLRAIHGLLRPRGHLILACKDAPHVRNFFRRLLGRGAATSRLWTRSRAEVHALLKETGFEPLRENYFYDPPFGSWKGPADVGFGLIEQALSALRVQRAAPYFVIDARCAD